MSGEPGTAERTDMDLALRIQFTISGTKFGCRFIDATCLRFGKVRPGPHVAFNTSYDYMDVVRMDKLQEFIINTDITRTDAGFLATHRRTPYLTCEDTQKRIAEAVMHARQFTDAVLAFVTIAKTIQPDQLREIASNNFFSFHAWPPAVDVPATLNRIMTVTAAGVHNGR